MRNAILRLLAATCFVATTTPATAGDLINLGRVQLRFLRRDLPANGHGARVIAAPVPAPAVTALPIPTAGVSAGASDKVGT